MTLLGFMQVPVRSLAQGLSDDAVGTDSSSFAESYVQDMRLRVSRLLVRCPLQAAA